MELPLHPSQVDRNYIQRARTLYKASPTRFQDLQFIKFIGQWLYAFFKFLDSEEEEKAAITALELYVNEASGVDERVVRFTRKFVFASFYPKLEAISSWRFTTIPHGDRDHNCASESENSALKRDFGGKTAPRDNVHNFARKIVRHEDKRCNSVIAQNQKALVSTRPARKNETMTSQLLRDLSHHVDDHFAELAVKHWEKGSGTQTYVVTGGTELLRDTEGEYQQFTVSPHPNLPPRRPLFPSIAHPDTKTR